MGELHATYRSWGGRRAEEKPSERKGNDGSEALATRSLVNERPDVGGEAQQAIGVKTCSTGQWARRRWGAPYPR
jgi:hypothetical protein